jgi:hypothetical protein
MRRMRGVSNRLICTGVGGSEGKTLFFLLFLSSLLSFPCGRKASRTKYNAYFVVLASHLLPVGA